MKMLSPDHVAVKIQILHPFYGYLEVDQCQRTRLSLDNDREKKKFLWNSVTFDAEISEPFKINNHLFMVYVTLPWDHGTDNTD